MPIEYKLLYQPDSYHEPMFCVETTESPDGRTHVLTAWSEFANEDEQGHVKSEPLTTDELAAVAAKLLEVIRWASGSDEMTVDEAGEKALEHVRKAVSEPTLNLGWLQKALATGQRET